MNNKIDIHYQQLIQSSIIKLVKELHQIFKSYKKWMKQLDKKYCKAFFDLHKSFYLKQMKRPKVIKYKDVKIQQFKILTPIFQFLKKETNIEQQMKEIFKSSTKIDKQYKKLQAKVIKQIEQEKKVIKKRNAIMHNITIKSKQNISKVDNQGNFSKLSQGSFTFKCQYTAYYQVINNNDQLLSIQDQNQLVTQTLVLKKPKSIQDFKQQSKQKLCRKMFENQTSFLLHFRNKNCPYIAKYYCQKQLVPFSNQIIYIEKYQQNLRVLYQKKFSFTQRLELAYKLSSFLYFLKDIQICYRDLNPNNIMIDKQFNPRVIDWGSCGAFYKLKYQIGDFQQKIKIQQLASTQSYYQHYSRIKEKLGQKYTIDEFYKGEYFDIYSFGIILNKIFQLYGNKDKQNGVQKLVFMCLKYLSQMCRQLNPENRLSAMEIRMYLYLLRKIMKEQEKIGSIDNNIQQQEDVNEEQLKIYDQNLNKKQETYQNQSSKEQTDITFAQSI